jgi:ribosomal protein S12 methylthiotransferase accessory factor YcaO
MEDTWLSIARHTSKEVAQTDMQSHDEAQTTQEGTTHTLATVKRDRLLGLCPYRHLSG